MTLTNKRRLLSLGVALVALAAGATFASAAASGSQPTSGAMRNVEAGDADRGDTAISGDQLKAASEAALAHTGGGRVTGTEVGDEESYYEVEVTLEDGRQIDVQLDRSFTVVGDETDGGADRD